MALLERSAPARAPDSDSRSSPALASAAASAPAPASAPGVADPSGLPSRPASPLGRCLLAAVNIAAVAFFLLSLRGGRIGFGPYRIDLDVYRIGGSVWLRHGDLYGVLPATTSGARLPFSYPPIAAVLLSPFSLMPMAVAGTVLTLSSVALTALVLRVFLRSVAGPRAGSWWTLAWLLPAALFLEPVRNTLDYGQVNIALMALVSVDCLTPNPRWPRGHSVRYWTSIVFQAGRAGSLIYAANQSIQAVLGRAGLDPSTPAGTAVWLALCAVVLVLAWYAMRDAFARSADAWALSLNAFAALLISPVSWSHHWVWAEPGLLALAVISRRHRHRAGLATAAAAGLVVFAAAPQWWFPFGENRESRWAVWQQIIGSSYVIFAAVILVLAGTVWRLRSSGSSSEGGRLAEGRAGVGADQAPWLVADPGEDHRGTVRTGQL